MAKPRPRRRPAPRARRPDRIAQALGAQLARVQSRGLGTPEPPGHARWRLLFEGTLSLLRAHDPAAFTRVVAKLERHGLVGRAPAWKLVNGRLTARERLTFVAGLFDPAPSDAVLTRVLAYGRDDQHVSIRGRRMLRRVEPRSVLVIAYNGARWKLTTEKPSGPRRRGDDALGERAVACVARRYGLSAASAGALIKRARVALHPTLRRWMASLDGPTSWGLTMAPGVTIPQVQGERKR